VRLLTLALLELTLPELTLPETARASSVARSPLPVQRRRCR
jgi:hypothetical protein